MKEQTKRLCVTAALLALAEVLSLLTLFPMPFGGGVTPASMLPVCLVALLYGTRWGAFSGVTFGLLQMLLGLQNFSYATSVWAVVIILLFDYLLAFGVLGLCDLFRFKTLGVAAACFLRFLCHFLSGVTVWRTLAGWDAVWYSLSYNGAYMLPELLITAGGAFLLLRTGALEHLKKSL